MLGRIMKLAISFLLLASAIAPASAETSQNMLVTSYATSPRLCQEFQQMYSSFNECPLTDSDCFVFKWGTEGNSKLTKTPFTELAVNQYGYTTISVAHAPGKPYSFVYLDGFQGDRHPRQLETWKVNTEQLMALIKKDPRPLQYEEWVKGAHQIKRETLATEFAQILAVGEKLSDDWSPIWMPIFNAKGTDYAIGRECSGTWAYGGYYGCNKVIKVTVKRVAADKTSIPVCEFVRRKGR
jgi:hypothetical protein